jgi:hypothetical protein
MNDRVTDLRVTQIASDSESMGASLKVLAAIARRELAVAEDLVRFRLRVERKLLVGGAAVDEEGRGDGVAVLLWCRYSISGQVDLNLCI